MKCSKARKITYLSEYPEVITGEMIEANRHVKECPDCKRFFEQEKTFSVLLKQKIKKESLPSELRERLMFCTTSKRRRPLELIYRLAAITALLMLFIGGYIYKLHYDTKSIVEDIINDHINFLSSSGIQISTSNPLLIEDWFKERLDFAVHIPHIRANLKGARLCLLRDKRLGLVFYEHSGSQISLFMTTELNPERLLSGKEVMIGDKEIHFVEQRGFNMLLWQERGVTYALVSQLGIEELKKILKEDEV